MSDECVRAIQLDQHVSLGGATLMAMPLAERESIERGRRSAEGRVKAARFPVIRTLGTPDSETQPSIDLSPLVAHVTAPLTRADDTRAHSGGGRVYQSLVTGGGARGSGEVAPDILKYQAGSGVGRASCALEVKIPYELVGVTPRAGDRWRGNVCRNIFTTISGGDRFTSWALSFRRTCVGANPPS